MSKILAQPHRNGEAVPFRLLLFGKSEDGIHMPQRFVDDLEGEICDEEVRECSLWNNILSADLDGEEVLLLNIRDHCISGVAHDFSCLICRDGIRKVSEALFHMCFELVLALVRDRDITLHHVYGVHWVIIVDHHRLLRGLGIEDSHGDLLASLGSFLLQISFHILSEDDISVRFGRSDLAWDNAVVQHPRRLALTDVKHLVELFQGDFAFLQHISSPPLIIGKELAELHTSLACCVCVEV